MLTETAITAAKAGTLASAVTMASTDANLQMVLLVGGVGGAAFFFKEVTHLTMKTTTLKVMAELFFIVPMSISTAGVVFYSGVNGANQYYNMGELLWIFMALMASLHVRKVTSFFGQTIKTIVTGVADVVVGIFKLKFGGKK